MCCCMELQLQVRADSQRRRGGELHLWGCAKPEADHGSARKARILRTDNGRYSGWRDEPGKRFAPLPVEMTGFEGCAKNQEPTMDSRYPVSVIMLSI